MLTDAQIDAIMKPTLEAEDPRDLYRKGGGASDHFRRDQIVQMLRAAYKAGWDGALAEITLPTPFHASN